MVDIALDPNMYYRSMSTADTLRSGRSGFPIRGVVSE